MKKYKEGHLLSVKHGIYHHVGISDGNGNVYENSRERGGSGLVIDHIFSSGKPISDHGIIGSLSANTILERAKTLITDQKPYKLFNNNCEHFIRTVYGMEATSPQLKKILIILGVSIVADKSKNPLIKCISGGAELGALVSSHTSENDKVIRNTLIGAAFGLITYAILDAKYSKV